MIYTTIDSPVGELLVAGDGVRISHLSFLGPGARRPPAPPPSWRHEPEGFTPLGEQLAEYFAGARRSFEVELDLQGTEWERRVWEALLRIPYGETRSYGQIAEELGSVRACRAVGVANARNPVAIVVPCHRVIGANGSLTGFGGGLERKRSLLDLEAGRLALTA
jgi:methylated-DNA-[protein]-cysteine S-methyltransferase